MTGLYTQNEFSYARRRREAQRGGCVDRRKRSIWKFRQAKSPVNLETRCQLSCDDIDMAAAGCILGHDDLFLNSVLELPYMGYDAHDTPVL